VGFVTTTVTVYISIKKGKGTFICHSSIHYGRQSNLLSVNWEIIYGSFQDSRRIINIISLWFFTPFIIYSLIMPIETGIETLNFKTGYCMQIWWSILGEHPKSWSIIKYINLVRGGDQQIKVKQETLYSCPPKLSFHLQSSCLGLNGFITLLLSYIEEWLQNDGLGPSWELIASPMKHWLVRFLGSHLG
jgi:hypothetical protein